VTEIVVEARTPAQPAGGTEPTEPIELREPREPREPRETREPRDGGEARPARGRIFLGVGEGDGVDEGKVREAVAALVPGLELLAADVRRTHTFLDVKPEDLDRAVAGLNGKDLAGKAVLAEKARRRRR
jgi:ribonuclease E